jgi:DNA-binding transcriptional MerR regulator
MRGVAPVKFLTTEEVALLARTAPSTVRYWRMIGKLDFGVKRGRRVLYEESATQRWLAGEDDQAEAKA